MNLSKWGARVANWKKTGAKERPLEYHLAHLSEEASEVFKEFRRITDELEAMTPEAIAASDNPYAEIRIGSKDGHDHAEGFGIELADVVLVALFIASVTGVDIEEQMEAKMKTNELRRAK